MTSEPGSETLRDAIGYWERRRLAYNIVLAAIVVGWGAVTWPQVRGALAPKHLVALFVLALCANACYCAAYLVDIPMQGESTRAAWRRKRWILWWAGLLLAILLESCWIADQIRLHFA
jgi:hypothetical protein